MAEELKTDAPQQTDITPTPEPTVPAVSTPPSEPQTPPSRRTAISEAFDKAVAKEDRTGRLHAQDGKFAPKTAPAAPVETPQGVQAPSRKPMPKAWKQDYASKWEALDPDIANFVADLEDRREQDFLKGIEQYKQQASWGQPLKQVLSPYENMLTTQYGSIDKGVGTLLQLSDYASRDPQGFIQWFAQQRGIPLNGSQPSADADPNQQAVQAALQPWLARVNGIEQQLQSFAQQQQQQQEAQAIAVVNEFLSEKDAKGIERFPVADDHIDAFSGHIQWVRNQNPGWSERKILETAYENLVWTVPEMRTARLERQEAERREKAAEEERRRQAAAVQVKGAPAASAPRDVDPKNRRAVIERAAEDRLN